MELAAGGRLFRAKWTAQIHEEWISAVLRDRNDLTRIQLERTRDLMNASVMDCLVDNYEDLVDAVTLPDGNDRHVLAAAIKGRCSAIVTFNLKHFPDSILAKYDIEAQHPDEFINHQFGIDQASVLAAARTCRTRLKSPAKSAEEYLAILRAQGLPKTVDALMEFAGVL
jgi:hypothetical protein